MNLPRPKPRQNPSRRHARCRVATRYRFAPCRSYFSARPSVCSGTADASPRFRTPASKGSTTPASQPRDQRNKAGDDQRTLSQAETHGHWLGSFRGGSGREQIRVAKVTRLPPGFCQVRMPKPLWRPAFVFTSQSRRTDSRTRLYRLPPERRGAASANRKKMSTPCGFQKAQGLAFQNLFPARRATCRRRNTLSAPPIAKPSGSCENAGSHRG